MISSEYANAYTEVLEILKYIPKEDYNKIPKAKINLFITNANKDYHFEYNPKIDLKEQKTSKIAKTIIAILFRDYWATDSQREKILAKEKYDMQKHEQEISEKYSYNNLFNKCEKFGNTKQNKMAELMTIVENKEKNFFRKILYKIKNVLKK